MREGVALNKNPELIFYGRHSGIIGVSKSKLYKTISDAEASSSGYDKVKNISFYN